jgi:Apea-like HEPN
MHELSISNGLSLFSDFIKTKRIDDLYKIILHSISFFSFALSNPDLHLRISQLIMIAEGLLLEEVWVKKMQDKTKNRLSKLMFPINSQEFVRLNSVMNAMYLVRHDITHKGNRLPIDKNKLRYLQLMLVELMKKIIVLNQKIKSKGDLITYVDSL